MAKIKDLLVESVGKEGDTEPNIIVYFLLGFTALMSCVITEDGELYGYNSPESIITIGLMEDRIMCACDAVENWATSNYYRKLASAFFNWFVNQEADNNWYSVKTITEMFNKFIKDEWREDDGRSRTGLWEVR